MSYTAASTLDGALSGSGQPYNLPSVAAGSTSPRLDVNAATSSSSTSTPTQAILSLNNDFVVSFQSADEASPTAYPRAPVDTQEDDVDDVEVHAKTHIRDIMRAINHAEYRVPQRRQPKKELSKEDAARWEEWQSKNHKDVLEILKGKNPQNAKHGMIDVMKGVESRAWILFGEIWKVHRDGYRLTNKPDTTSKCSARLQSMIQQLKHYSMVRKDFLQDMRFEIFATSPESYAADKVKSCWSNDNRRRNGKRGLDEITDHKPSGGTITDLEGSLSQVSSDEQKNTRPRKKTKGSEDAHPPSAEMSRDTNTIESDATRVTLSNLQGSGLNRSESIDVQGGFSDSQTAATGLCGHRTRSTSATIDEDMAVDGGLPATLQGA